jgi:hypothetical protein
LPAQAAPRPAGNSPWPRAIAAARPPHHPSPDSATSRATSIDQ